jgi:cell division transport system permease protein
MSDAFIQELDAELKTLVPNVVLDTHESWLADILKLTNALQAATWLITIMIWVTTVTAIAGAVKSRIAIHKSDVELLHLMGASDTYISRQFQRHTWILSFQGAMAGMLTGALTLALIGYFAGDTGAALLPEFQIRHYHLGTLAALPALACIIAAMTARITVLRALAKMP